MKTNDKKPSGFLFFLEGEHATRGYYLSKSKATSLERWAPAGGLVQYITIDLILGYGQ
jgi:hypothetical protein